MFVRVKVSLVSIDMMVPWGKEVDNGTRVFPVKDDAQVIIDHVEMVRRGSFEFPLLIHKTLISSLVLWGSYYEGKIGHFIYSLHTRVPMLQKQMLCLEVQKSNSFLWGEYQVNYFQCRI